VSLFASRDAAMSRLVLVLVNRDQTLKVKSQIALQGCGTPVSSRLFSYGAGSSGLTEQASTVAEKGVVATLEPFTFSVLEVSLGKNTQP
jgi:hypothetical protein